MEDGKVGVVSVEVKDPRKELDASKNPPFTLGQLRAAIPKHCWERSITRSLRSVANDITLVMVLASVALITDNWFLWPLYWFAQGTMFWALFVLGHDCGHGSFSSSKSLNNLVGHIIHTFILVPYHGWRISHRAHHANHGHVENDESWYPMTESRYETLSVYERLGRLEFPFPLFAYPFYLWCRTPGKSGTHYNPSSELFNASEYTEVLTSTASWLAMVSILTAAVIHMGFLWTLKVYFMPYVVNIVWISVVTYLHHHGYEKKVPWYRGQEWSFMRGGLSTIDRDYGIFNKIHHDIGTHVVHHLFPQIPHYHLVEATAAVKPLLGNYYREPKRSRLVPVHLIPVLVESFSEDHYVADDGDIVYYQKDTKKGKGPLSLWS